MKIDDLAREAVKKITKFDIDLDPHIEYYSAYVYRITVTFLDGTWKIYIGAHKGLILDSYNFSSESKEFLKDLRNPDTKVYFEIVKKGTEYDMFDLENQMLEKVDAKNPDNKEYYNNTNGGSRYTEVSAKVEAYVKSLNEKLNNGELDEYKVSTPIVEVKKWEKVQVRADELTDGDYTDGIAAKINSKLGDTSFLPPGLSFKDWNGSSLWCDGSQRLDGVDKSKNGEDIIHYHLPKKLWKPLIKNNEIKVTSAIEDLASARNPHVDSPLNMKTKDWAQLLVKRSKEYDQINSDFNLRYLLDRNVVNTKSVISKAQSIWRSNKKAEKLKPNGRYLDTKSPEAKKLIQDKKEKLERDHPDAIIVTGTTATFGVGHFANAISKFNDNKKFLGIEKHSEDDLKLIIPLVYHPGQDEETKWENGLASQTKVYAEQFIGSAGYILGSYRYVDLIVSVANE
jgi:hypothetical protein